MVHRKEEDFYLSGIHKLQNCPNAGKNVYQATEDTLNKALFIILVNLTSFLFFLFFNQICSPKVYRHIL
jgi:hypothetical protein